MNLTSDETQMIITALHSSASELCKPGHGSVSDEYAAKYRDLAQRLLAEQDGSAQITITARMESSGLLVSLQTDGDYSSEVIDRRFYSIAQIPPPGLDPADFWAPILGHIANFLATREPEEDEEISITDVDGDAWPDERDVDDELYELSPEGEE